MIDQARVVIIGGGIVGCSIAYHLTKLGWTDVAVIEKGELTSGSTWHAAGLVGQLRSSRNITRMLQQSVQLYERLEAETEQSTGWKRVGSLRLACTADRWMEVKKAATTAKSFGLEMQLLSPREAQELFPIMSTERVIGAALLPSDGYADPSGITMALAKGARAGGAQFIRNTRVTGIMVERGEAQAVVTDQGVIKAQIIVNAAGLWAREIGRMAGVNVPVVPMQHQYMVSEKIPDLPKNLPTLRDPDLLVYYKEEAGGLVMGGYEPNPIPWHAALEGVPKNFGQELLPEDHEHFAQLAEKAMVRTPILGQVGVRKLINGPEAFTTDGTFIMGRAPELRNFFVAAGFNAHGIAAGGGAGKMLAEWIVHGEPSLDLWPVDIRRFSGYHKSTKYLVERTSEHYGKHYTIAWPHEESHSGRGLRRSPLYDTLKAKGAVFGAKFGWERPNWFAPKGVRAEDLYTFGRPNWFEHVGAEHRAIREGVGIIDQTSFSKFEVRGPGAFRFLQWLAAGNVDKPVGGLTYTQLLNERGGIECDLTIVRLAEDHFYVVTGTAFGTHDLAWIKNHLPEDGSVIAYDVTGSRSVLNVCGPKARELLRRCTADDVSNESFKFMTSRQICVGAAPVIANRVTYVGELGWELHTPIEYTQHVYETLMEAGRDLGVRDCGYRAIESLRLEKGYRYWSSDLNGDRTPYAAGLGFAVSMKKPDFLGKAALLAEKDAGGPRETLACFTLEKDFQLFGGETISHGGRVIGVVTSGGYGYTLGKTIAYGYVPTELMKETSFEIEAFGESSGATRHDGVLYDPERKKILA